MVAHILIQFVESLTLQTFQVEANDPQRDQVNINKACAFIDAYVLLSLSRALLAPTISSGWTGRQSRRVPAVVLLSNSSGCRRPAVHFHLPFVMNVCFDSRTFQTFSLPAICLHQINI